MSGVRILCVDDEVSSLALLEALLVPHGYELFLASSGKRALELLSAQRIDLVLLDVLMPGESGYEICSWIKGSTRHRELPIVMITSLSSTEERIRSIEAGAEDFISKPYNQSELLMRIRMLLKIKGLRDSLRAASEDLRLANDELTTTSAELSRLNALLTLQATTDALTGIANRRRFDEVLTAEVARSRRFGQPLSLVMFDIDKFKVVNDDFGHLCGDEVLRDLTALFRGFVRLHDTFARWGGDEFVVVLTNTPVEGALRFAEKLRAEAERHSFRSVARVTCSFGVAQWSKDEAAVLFRGRVDSAMYSAKHQGRNRVEAACAAPPLTRES